MTTEEFEREIVGRLEPMKKDPGVDVDKMPGDVGKYRMIHPVGAVLVQYERSGFTAPRALNSISQVRGMRFFVFVLSRDLRDGSGAYGLMDSVRGTLTGFAPRGAGKMYPLSERLVGERDGIWIYQMTFECQTVAEES